MVAEQPSSYCTSALGEEIGWLLSPIFLRPMQPVLPAGSCPLRSESDLHPALVGAAMCSASHDGVSVKS